MAEWQTIDSAPPDIVKRLHDACVGHPAAQIPWPHRLLHDAADEIDRLRGLLAEPSEAMVNAALRDWFSYSGGYVYSDSTRSNMRAALVAAGKAIVEATQP